MYCRGKAQACGERDLGELNGKCVFCIPVMGQLFMFSKVFEFWQSALVCLGQVWKVYNSHSLTQLLTAPSCCLSLVKYAEDRLQVSFPFFLVLREILQWLNLYLEYPFHVSSGLLPAGTGNCKEWQEHLLSFFEIDIKNCRHSVQTYFLHKRLNSINLLKRDHCLQYTIELIS